MIMGVKARATSSLFAIQDFKQCVELQSPLLELVTLAGDQGLFKLGFVMGTIIKCAGMVLGHPMFQTMDHTASAFHISKGETHTTNGTAGHSVVGPL